MTIFPFPRTAFTLAAGLLFGPLLGVSLAVVASTISAVIALLLVRAAGWHLDRLVKHPRVDTLNARLAERGWPTVLSMRMIPAVPFSVLNYAAGSSAVRVVPYTLATFVGLLPGTAAVVILGDALTGNVSPLLFLVSLCTATLGIAGLTYEIRTHGASTGSGPPRTRVGAAITCRSTGPRLLLTCGGPFTVIVPNRASNDEAATRAGLQSLART